MKINLLFVLLSGVAVSAMGGCSIPASRISQTPSPYFHTPSASFAPSSVLQSSKDANFIVKVVQKAGPAVVRIDAARTIISRGPAEFSDPFLRRFFFEIYPLNQDGE